MSLLPPEMLAGMESGEVELDFDNLDDATLRRIDGWLRTLYPDQGGFPGSVESGGEGDGGLARVGRTFVRMTHGKQRTT